MLLRLLVVVLITQGLHSAHWSATLDHVIYACEGGTVSLPWRYALDTGDVFIQVEWYYNGASQEMIAIESHGGFLAYPAFGNRVEQVDNAGLRLTHVITGDSGNYTAVVSGYDSSGTHFELTQSVTIQISDQLMTQDGSVHVTVNPEAVLDTTADQWAIQLQCGHFTFVGNPPYPVEWTTPQGETRTSTNFTNGHFDLLLTNPVHGGNYTCRVPAQHLATSCLHGNDSSRGETSVFVDKVEARLTLLEKENQQLKNQLQQRLQPTEQRVQLLENMAVKRVSFQAVHLTGVHPPSGSPLLMRDVLSNQGNAYNHSTGYFIAPYPGTYFFIGTSGTDTGHTYAYLDLYFENTQLDRVKTFDENRQGDFSSVHGVVHMNTGQRVYLRSVGGSYYSAYTAFTGFLLSPDP